MEISITSTTYDGSTVTTSTTYEPTITTILSTTTIDGTTTTITSTSTTTAPAPTATIVCGQRTIPTDQCFIDKLDGPGFGASYQSCQAACLANEDCRSFGVDTGGFCYLFHYDASTCSVPNPNSPSDLRIYDRACSTIPPFSCFIQGVQNPNLSPDATIIYTTVGADAYNGCQQLCFTYDNCLSFLARNTGACTLYNVPASDSIVEDAAGSQSPYPKGFDRDCYGLYPGYLN